MWVTGRARRQQPYGPPYSEKCILLKKSAAAARFDTNECDAQHVPNPSGLKPSLGLKRDTLSPSLSTMKASRVRAVVCFYDSSMPSH